MATLCLLGRGAYADDVATDGNPLQIHGFVSQGALLSTDNNFLAKTSRGSLEFTEAGINLTKSFDDRVSMGVQLFTRDLGPEGNYSAKFDWLYIDYRWRDWLGLRAGRVKLPFGLYNDTSDIDAVQPVILLPQSVYSATSRDFLLAQTGVELYGYRPLGDRGALDYRAYAGTIYLSLPDSPGYHVDEVDVPYIAGAQVFWETPIEGLKLGGSLLVGELDATYSATAMPAMPIDFALRATQWLGSVEYTNNALLIAAEYGRAYSESTVSGMEQSTTGDRGYLLAGYRWRPTLQTTLYYSLLYPNADARSGRENHQHDAAASVRWDITPHWQAKLEGHAMRGTAALSPALNDGTLPEALVNKWYLVAAKTTVYF